MSSVVWFRRDLRLADHLALAEAAGAGPVVPLFVLDPALVRPAGSPRLTFLYRCLRALDESTGGRLVIRAGDPVAVVPQVAREADAARVLASADFGPYGHRRDGAVDGALRAERRRLAAIGSPYAVDPGVICKQDGTPFQVFSPFYRSWSAHRGPAPAPAPSVEWVRGLRSDAVPDDPPVAATLPPAGEAAALARLDAFAVDDYAKDRDRPAADATSRLSP